MRVLVLGGTNLTGPYFIRRLAGMGHQVTVFHRGRHNAVLPAEAALILGDLADPPPELLALQPDIVVHMWALTEADALRFLDLFTGRARRAIVISSCDVYRAFGRLHRQESGVPDPGPLTEDAPLRESRYPYRGRAVLDIETQDYDKILVENALISQRQLPVTILRYPAVYGPPDPHHRFREWIQEMDAGAEIRIQDDYARWRWTHGYVEDVAQSVVLAATNERAAGFVFNVGEAHTPTMLERLEDLGRVAGWSGRIKVVPAADVPDEKRMAHDFSHPMVVDTTRIREQLGYEEVVRADDALRRTVEWERNGAEHVT